MSFKLRQLPGAADAGMTISTLNVTAGEDVQHPPALLAQKRSLGPQKKPIQDLAANPSPVQE
jgi:hypothetical protein